MPLAALAASGADAVMIGRARARPAVAARPDRARISPAGARRPRRRSAEQLAIIERLYDEMLVHHGMRIGRRHARKHLGWALDVAAETRGRARRHCSTSHRSRVLTADEPAAVRRLLAEAFDDFAAVAGASSARRRCERVAA